MRLLSLGFIRTLLAITQVATTVALPTHQNNTLASAKDHKEIDKRANAQLTVPLQSAGLETWEGSKAYLGLFGAGLSNDEVRASAKQTYEGLSGRLPATLLVSVIFVPGGGLAAGTIWRDGEQFFDASTALNAPFLWAAVPGVQQALLGGMYNENKWHAEAVAVRLAEMTFGPRLVGGQWPVGTKIATYGKISNGYPGPRAACSLDHTSVTRPCSLWLPGLNIMML